MEILGEPQTQVFPTCKWWLTFYDNFNIIQPSNFAKYVLTQLRPNQRILDLGCGNGRDTLYFKQSGHTVLGIDQASPKNQKDFLRISIEDFITSGCTFAPTVIYARWLLHSISYKLQHQLLQWCCSKQAILFIECRSDKDKIILQDHYRRLINYADLLDQLKKRFGYTIIQSGEARGFSPTKTDDPLLIRVVAK